MSCRHQVGLVSLEAPLISNLSVLENIALIRQYHSRLSRCRAEELARKCLRRLQLEDLAGRRNPSLREEQRFCVMVLRAVMLEDSILVLDRPFEMMPALGESRFLYDIIHKVAEMHRECHVFDYFLNERRYMGGSGHEAENRT